MLLKYLASSLKNNLILYFLAISHILNSCLCHYNQSMSIPCCIKYSHHQTHTVMWSRGHVLPWSQNTLPPDFILLAVTNRNCLAHPSFTNQNLHFKILCNHSNIVLFFLMLLRKNVCHKHLCHQLIT